VLRELGIGASLAYSEMEALVAAFDPHGSGKVDYEDFCRYCMHSY
jgi:Ca2+-binding EF-hand superfamily protein